MRTITTCAGQFFPHHYRIDVLKYVVSERVIRVWNSLPAEPKHYSSLLQFKAFNIGTDSTQFVSL